MPRTLKMLQRLAAALAIGLIAVLYAPVAAALQTIDDIIKEGSILESQPEAPI
jgi:hypothetical protein